MATAVRRSSASILGLYSEHEVDREPVRIAILKTGKAVTPVARAAGLDPDTAFRFLEGEAIPLQSLTRLCAYLKIDWTTLLRRKA